MASTTTSKEIDTNDIHVVVNGITDFNVVFVVSFSSFCCRFLVVFVVGFSMFHTVALFPLFNLLILGIALNSLLINIL